MKTMIKYIAAALSALTLTAACTETVMKDQIYLSHSSFTFKPQGETVEVKVDANTDWTVSGQPEWITVADQSDTSIFITAAANDADQMRDGAVEFKAGTASKTLVISQLGKSFTGKFVDVNYAAKVNFSRNGRFHAGVVQEYLSDGNTTVTFPLIVDSYTGEQVKYDGDQDYSEVRAISDDGKTFAVMLNSGGTVLFKDGQPTKLEMSGYMWITVEAMSSDGSVMVGYAQSEETRAFVPVKWTNMQAEVLEMPETNSWGETLYNGAMARGCSEDGSVIYGSEWDNRGLIYWRDGEMHFPGKDEAQIKDVIIESWMGIQEGQALCTVTKAAEPYSMSPNGRYIATGFNDYKDNGDQPSTALNYAAIVDTETGEVHYVKSDFLNEITGISVDNDGICYGGTPATGVSEGYVIDYKTSSVTPITEWMQTKYGIVVDMDRIVLGVSSDGNIINGWKVVPTLLGVQYYGWYYIVDPEVR